MKVSHIWERFFSLKNGALFYGISKECRIYFSQESGGCVFLRVWFPDTQRIDLIISINSQIAGRKSVNAHPDTRDYIKERNDQARNTLYFWSCNRWRVRTPPAIIHHYSIGIISYLSGV